MHHIRNVPGSLSSNMRKTSRYDGKPSMLPQYRRPGSIDRQSSEMRRPSSSHKRSSSADNQRGTMALGSNRLSRETSASKIPINRKSRSQQNENRLGMHSTPKHSNYFPRSTTTPLLQRTPSADRLSRGWESSLERALAFVTYKDQRPTSNAVWQRAEAQRVGAALRARGGEDAAAALVRPLTISRFVELTSALLSALTVDTRLNTDNYITKLPHTAKKLLYPGNVSKSWLRTVNTLHAFPHALALISYLLDMVEVFERPVSEDTLYKNNNELSKMQRQFIRTAWLRFQESSSFDDLIEQYQQDLKKLFAKDDEKLKELKHVIGTYEDILDSPEERAARAAEQRAVDRRFALEGEVRRAREGALAAAAELDTARAKAADHTAVARALDTQLQRLESENHQLDEELKTQEMTVAERTRLLDDVDYRMRVLDSKQDLAKKINKMILTMEKELAQWQNSALEVCVRYKQKLIDLAAQIPELTELAVDENELMEKSCVTRACAGAERLQALGERLDARLAERARAQVAKARSLAAKTEETRAKIEKLKLAIQKEDEQMRREQSQEEADAAAWLAEEKLERELLEEVAVKRERRQKVAEELKFWMDQDRQWKTRLSELESYVKETQERLPLLLEREKEKRLQLFHDTVLEMSNQIDALKDATTVQ